MSNSSAAPSPTTDVERALAATVAQVAAMDRAIERMASAERRVEYAVRRVNSAVRECHAIANHNRHADGAHAIMASQLAYAIDDLRDLARAIGIEL